MKKLVSVVIMMLLMTGISFGYTLTINAAGTTETREIEAGRTVKVALSDRSPAKYVVNSDNVILKVIGNRRELVMPEGDVEIGIIRPGDYIAYQPSSTSYTVTSDRSGYTSDQTFDPSSATSWKVFKNTGDHIEIISSESVETLTLRGKTGYIYAIDTLNNMCVAYVNPTYATSGRCLGYGNGEGIIDESKYPITWEETYTNGNNGIPYRDSYRLEDIRLTNVKDGEEYPLRVSGNVWLASRGLYVGSRYTGFSVGVWGPDGYLDNLYQSYSDGASNTLSRSYGVRPIISLNPDIKIIGGDGSSENPWQISL